MDGNDPTDDSRQEYRSARDRPSPGTVGRRSFLRATGVAAGGALLGAAATPAAAQSPRRLSVEGNQVVTADGEVVTLRGLNVIDPKRAERMAPARGRDAGEIVSLLTGDGWHPDVLRVPVSPNDVGEHAPQVAPEPPAFDSATLEDYLETYLDPVVEQCADAGVYAIVDFHRHWDPPEDADYSMDWGDAEAGTVNETLLEEVTDFWEVVAPRYAGDDHVLYELYNEPREPGMWGATDADWGGDPEEPANVWDLFLEFAQPIVDEVRSHADNVALVGSPGWSQSPAGALLEPVDGDNLAYTYHIYPGHEASQAQDWETGPNGQGVEGVYEEHPLFVTEFGWNPALDDEYLQGTTEEFGRPFLEWLESSPSIHWTAWNADVWWEPRMFDRGDWAPEDGEETEHPYEDAVAEDCPDRPCEWLLRGRDVGDQQDMGEYVRLALEAEGVPEDYLDEEDDAADDGDDATDGADDGSGDDAGGDDAGDDATGDADDGTPGFGVAAGVAGVGAALAALRRSAVGGDGERTD